jgi:hypothetical protein
LSAFTAFYASDVDEEIRGWLERMAGDEGRLVRAYAELVLPPEWQRRFGVVEIAEAGPYGPDPEAQ